MLGPVFHIFRQGAEQQPQSVSLRLRDPGEYDDPDPADGPAHLVNPLPDLPERNHAGQLPRVTGADGIPSEISEGQQFFH